MMILPVSAPAYDIKWSTLHAEPLYARRQVAVDVWGPQPSPSSPQAVATETARVQAMQMASMPTVGIPVVGGSTAPAAQSVKIGNSEIGVVPVLGFNSWGFI